MFLKIRHQSVYDYDKPVPYALQRLRLTPKTNAMQTVHDWKVTAEGAIVEVVYTDGYDNIVELIRHERNSHEIILTAEGTVTTNDTVGVFGQDGISLSPAVFLRETPLTAPGERIQALVGATSGIANELDRLHALKSEIHAAMTFDTTSTDATTMAEAAFAAGHGVCQDYAQIFVGAARAAGIPARYVSGYLLMPDTVEQTASHAWAEAYVNGIGWVGFDAANDTCPTPAYVRLAAGLDYRDAAPVTGIRMGESAERLAVHLKVEQ